MTWGSAPDQGAHAAGTGRREAVELVGTHLRLNGVVSLHRFNRLSDLINSSSGYVRVQNARLLRRNGDPTNLVLPEMMVDQDEISFIASVDPREKAIDMGPEGSGQAVANPEQEGGDVWAGLGAAVPGGGGDAWGAPGGGALTGGGVLERPPREFVLFTPGHTMTGKVLVYGETDLAGFVDASEPRFVPVTDVTARSLADRRIISHFKFVLINRTQMIAASEIGRAGDIRGEDVPEL
jgi:hypothetical protein